MQAASMKEREHQRLLEAARRTDTAGEPVSDRQADPSDSGELAALDVPSADYRADIEKRIAELCRSERQARAEVRALRESHQSKDRFLAMLSHDMRMPLQPVLSAAALLLRDPRMPPDLLDELRTIQRNVQLEARLIDDLLDMTRMASGKFSLERMRIDLHAVIRRAVEICRADAEQKRLSLGLRLEASRFWVHGDPGRLQQVIWNLVRNSVKFTPAGGEVTIRTSDGADGKVIVEVTDNGAGIAAELLPTIFEPFKQGAAMSLRHAGGLGLGLAISKLLIERHEGMITAASEGPGRGATFTVALATVESPAPAAPRRGAIADRPMNRLLRIVLVDDDVSTCIVMGKLLESTGHQVRSAHSCAEALELARSAPFDLLLCDLGLPDGSGLELLNRLRGLISDPFKAVALTGFGNQEDVQRTQAAGFDAHLTKPITLEQLVRQINRLFP